MSPPHAPPMCSSFHTNRRISSVQPTTRRPGTIFNPPHFRARGGASWRDRRLTLTADLSYIGGVDDSRTVPASRVASMTTLDLTARYRTEGSGLTGGLDVTLGIQNLFNDKIGRAHVGTPVTNAHIECRHM